MEQKSTDADDTLNRLPSLHFVRAIAQLLETDPNDILTELDHRSRRSAAQEAVELRPHYLQQDSEPKGADYYLG